MVKEVNATTGEEIERPMTEKEIAELEAEKTAKAEAEAERVAATEEREAAKQAVLDRLGLTAEEAALLLGGN